MGSRNGRTVVRLGAALALLAVLAACQTGHERGATPVPGGSAAAGTDAAATQAGDAGGASGGRKLTVVKGSAPQASEAAAVDRIHRLEGASIEKWLTDDALIVMTTRQIKAATATEEAKFEYATSMLDLVHDQQNLVKRTDPAAEVVKEDVSPDGRHAFVQKWRDKYTAVNSIVDKTTGTSVEVKGGNYMERGGWLDNDTYVLAAGSTDGPGELRAIATDGTYAKLALNDPDVEYYDQFAAGQGRLYYTDKKRMLKSFAPGEKTPTTLVSKAIAFRLSPDGSRIAVETAVAEGKPGSELRVYDTKGQAQGTLIGKGDLVPDMGWSSDSAKLAFAVYTEDRSGMNGVYLLSAATGTVTPVAPDAYPQYPLSWSPSGIRLGVTTSDKNGMPVTQIIDFQS